MPTKEDFEKALDDWFRECEKEGNSYVDVRAGDLHRRVGEYPGSGQRMPTCCDVMYENRQSVDNILHQPSKGNGASLEIKYALPRTPINRGRNVNKEDGKLANFSNVTIIINGSRQDTPYSWDCPVCQGEGVIHDPFYPDKECLACKGEGRWKANIQRDRLLTCNRCKGMGTIEDQTQLLMRNVCPRCCGSGKRPPDSGKDLT